MLSEKTDQCCYTSTETKTFTFKWVIRNFSTRREKLGESVKSSLFKDNEIASCNWQLKLFPNGNDKDKADCIALYLVGPEKNEPIPSSLKFDIYLQNNNGEQLQHVSTTYPKGKPDWGWSDVLKRDLISNRLPNDELIIYCTLSTLKDVQYGENIKFKTPECHAFEDFGRLLSNECFSDVTLSVKGQEFKVHKAILAVRSPVFAAMFKHDMQETRSNRVEITDIDANIVQELLQFIYTGKCSNLETHPEKLLEVADKYGMERLKAICEELLGKSLTIKNAADTLTLADSHSAQQLTKVAVSFIISHYSAVKRTRGWKSMKLNPTLQLLIDQALSVTRPSNQAS